MTWAAHSPTPPNSSAESTLAHRGLDAVLTDLLVSASRISRAAIERAIPPACRRSVDEAVVSVAGDHAFVETPRWTPRRGARHLVPSFSLLGGDFCSFRFELSALVEGRWTPWIATTTIGSHAFPPHAPPAGPLSVEVDMFSASLPVESMRLRARVHPTSALGHPLLLTLSASDLDPRAEPRLGVAWVETAPLRVPARSQMEEPAEIRDRICSPTSVAMVLEYWGQAVSVKGLAAEIFHPELDRYGVWPAAMAAAARRGMAGYLLRFPDWSAAAWCLAQGMPIVASIRYEQGELEGAPIARTDGHLVVLTGADRTDVLVNDPAGLTASEVPRRYRREELARAWLERGGVGYVFFRPA